MKKDKENEKENLSRREFFKRAAKGALPIIGGIIMANIPFAQTKANDCGYSCNNSCYGTCYGSCQSLCYNGCNGSCSGSCQRNCLQSCYQGCLNTCHGGCERYNNY
jgi:CXXX repeat radical SAM target protein